MEKRQSVWKFIPPGTVIGCAILIVMAFFPPLRSLLVFVALLVIGYTAIRYLVLLGDAEETIKALKAPEKQVKVQPEGPSFQEVLPFPGLMIIAEIGGESLLAPRRTAG